MSKDNELKLLGLKPTDNVLIAYSGGSDSTFLLIKALEYFKDIEVAYVDYHDSEYVEQEERIIENFCAKNNIKLNRKNVYLDWRVSHFEERARDIRYKYFRKLVDDKKLKGVIVAHHANDDAETYLFQKARNSVVNNYGLVPISHIYGVDVYRPLLKYTKSEIVQYLNDNHIEFFDDPTNYNHNRIRDNIRMNVLVNDDILKQTLKEKEEAQRINNKDKEECLLFLKKKTYLLNEFRLFNEKNKKRILYWLSSKCIRSKNEQKKEVFTNLSYEYLKSNKTGFIELDKDIFLYKTKDEFFFGRKLFSNEYSYEIKEPGLYHFKEFNIDLRNPEKIKVYAFPVYIRGVKALDSIGTELMCKNPYVIMKKHNVPSFLRDRYPAIFDQNGKIIYIPFDWKSDKYIKLLIKKIHFKF